MLRRSRYALPHGRRSARADLDGRRRAAVNSTHAPHELAAAERAVALGTFDGVHRGHLAVVEAARALGLRTTVVTFDPHPRTVLGNRVELLSTLERRLELLADAGVAETLVVEFTPDLARREPADFAESLLRRIGTRVIVVGENFRFGRAAAGDPALLEQLGFEVRTVPLVEGISSSDVRALLHAGDVVGAARLLGRPPELDGTVVLG